MEAITRRAGGGARPRPRGAVVPARRIASLLASGTEILCALGLRDRLVGISHECDFPPDVRSLPVLTAPRLDPNAPSGDIDCAVRERMTSGLSLYEIHVDRLRELAPDLIVTQDQCHVCAVSLEQVEAEVRGWIGSEVRVVSLRPVTLRDALEDVARVAESAGVAGRGREVLAELRRRLDHMSSRARCAAGHKEKRPEVMCLEWLDPPILSGNWMPEIVRAAGGESLGAAAGGPSPRVAWEEIVRARPEALLLLPCGFDLERALAESRAVLDRPEVRATPAFQSGQIWALDGNAYFNRSGPRLVDSLEILASILHPESFDPPPPSVARRLVPAPAAGASAGGGG